MSDVLEVRNEGRLCVLRLNRPDRKNALDRALVAALHRGFREAAADDDVWAIVLTGNGDAFCSGLDFGEPVVSGGPRPDDGEPVVERERNRGHLTIAMCVECEKPILAGVNGVAVGGGVSLAMNADIRIASPSARFHPGYSRDRSLARPRPHVDAPAAIGYERAMRFLLEQRMVSATEALELGLVSEVVERDADLDARLIEYGTMLADVAPIAARQTKRLLLRAEQSPDLGAHLDLEIELVMQALRSEDGAEAMRAMMSGEKPTFHGR